MDAIFSVVGRLHPSDGNVRRDAFGQVEAVIRRFESAGTGSFPFVSVTEALAHGLAYFGSFPRAHPDNRVDARDIRELELIDTGLGIFCFFGGWIV
jgi:hypothetical protein